MSKCWYVHPQLIPEGEKLSARRIATVERNRKRLSEGQQVLLKQEKCHDTPALPRVTEVEDIGQD